MSAQAYSIRMATVGDVQELASVAAGGYRSGFAGIMDDTQLALRDEAHFQQRFGVEWPFVAMAMGADGRCHGFVEVRDGTLDMLFIRPDKAGTGCATALLRQAEAMGAIRLECFAENARARRFYEREGWKLAAEYQRAFAGRTMSFVSYTGALTGSA